ncbi:hypothetical protein [Streptomyces cyaneofuscatus]|uniref:hypothetical protein n=1 Tax=Streptomyces cyaneofuscatus TaxID=66883 RepID=UPI00380B51CA
MSTRRPLGPGPVPVVDNPETQPEAPVPLAGLAAERLQGAATAPSVRATPLSTGPTTTG